MIIQFERYRRARCAQVVTGRTATRLFQLEVHQGGTDFKPLSEIVDGIMENLRKR